MNFAELVESLNELAFACACCGQPVSLFADLSLDAPPTGFTFEGEVFCLDCVECLQAELNKPHPLTLKTF